MINESLTLSTEGRELLQAVEKLSLLPYDDQTGDITREWCKGATIGYGHLITPGEWPKFANGISKEQAVELFEKDLAPFEQAIKKAIIVPLKQNQFDALVILAFNIGETKFRQSSVVRMVNDPRAVTSYPTLESAWKAWNKSQGEVMKGLVNRRACEWGIYSKGVYQRW